VLQVEPSIGAAYASASKLAGEQGSALFIAGSLFLAGSILEIVREDEDG